SSESAPLTPHPNPLPQGERGPDKPTTSPSGKARGCNPRRRRFDPCRGLFIFDSMVDVAQRAERRTVNPERSEFESHRSPLCVFTAEAQRTDRGGRGGALRL